MRTPRVYWIGLAAAALALALGDGWTLAAALVSVACLIVAYLHDPTHP
jgi:membrane protein implicated in regulation of membrane protease activity